MPKYWKATGNTLTESLALHAKWKSGMDKLQNVAKSHGAVIGWSDGLLYEFCFMFKEEPDMKLWKLVQPPNAYRPRLATKVGKAIQKEIDDISRSIPNPLEFSSLIKLKGLVAPGTSVGENAVIYVTPDDYEPPTGVSLTRIADTEAERLIA